MTLIAIGLITGFNFLIIYWKFSRGRYFDGVLDLGIFAVICYLTAGTITGLMVGMVASFIVSIYLLIVPPKIAEI